MMLEYDTEVKELQKKYYTTYYQSILNLPDYHNRVEERFNEEITDKKRLENIFKLMNINDFENKNILIIGLGTGSVLGPLNEMGFKNIYGIEPNEDALHICHLKAKILNIDSSKLMKDIAEELPFQDLMFDIIYSWSVFEHVQDVSKSFQEAIRVLKNNGDMYVALPNYNFPIENHYKIPAFTFLGKTITKIFALAFRKKCSFIDSLQFLTPYKVDKILKEHPNIIFFRIHHPYKEYQATSTLGKLYLYYSNIFTKKLNINKNQEIIIKKLVL